MSMSKDASNFEDHPIITYSNRIQRHMFDLSSVLANKTATDMIYAEDKNKLRTIIINLPPEGKKALEEINTKLDYEITKKDFFNMYSQVSDWIYKNLLQDAFRAKPRFGSEGKL